MAIYVGENNALLLKKYRSVVELYKGDKKIFGYNDSAEGKVIAVGNAHPIEHKLKVEVKSKNLFNKDMDFTSDNFISEMSYSPRSCPSAVWEYPDHRDTCSYTGRS